MRSLFVLQLNLSVWISTQVGTVNMLIWKSTVAKQQTWARSEEQHSHCLPSHTLCVQIRATWSFFDQPLDLIYVGIYTHAFTRETTTEQTGSDANAGFLVCRVVGRCLIWQRLILMLMSPEWQHGLGAQGPSRHKPQQQEDSDENREMTKGLTAGDFCLLELAEASSGEHLVFLLTFIHFLTEIVGCSSQSERSLGK